MLAAEEGNAVRKATGVDTLNVRLQSRGAQAQALEPRANDDGVKADRPSVRSMADGLAGVFLSSVEDLFPVLGASHVPIRYDGIASHRSDHVGEHESSHVFTAAWHVPASHLHLRWPILSLSNITNVEEAIAQGFREPDAIFGLSTIRKSFGDLVATAQRKSSQKWKLTSRFENPRCECSKAHCSRKTVAATCCGLRKASLGLKQKGIDLENSSERQGWKN